MCIMLPEEDARRSKGDFGALLRKNMYSLRELPKVWQKVVKHMLQQRVFRLFVCTFVFFFQPSVCFAGGG